MENNTKNTLIITALFAESNQADSAYQSLLESGISKDNISLVMSDYAHQGSLSEADKTQAADSGGRGALLGGAAGGITAAVAAVATNIALPGLGIVFVGPLLAGLAGAAGGAIAGGAIGAMVGNGFPKEQAELYDAKIREGSFLVSVNPDNLLQNDSIINIFRKNNGYNIYIHYGSDTGQPA
ncbi:hypothetical protein [Dyadobacter pollutisoli]|uniref:DUF1269 domain-containing protein n=1 Tax=Dyadobacter pollutisoli TaxID=2910158 RepID=A0A9E8SMM3_9BACT|nr:hypothetical protein [Dyadobacter pollutisoli]WAC13469.1 hypothetical protein ON006_05825 [Dyadobacter pollutisoli]